MAYKTYTFINDNSIPYKEKFINFYLNYEIVRLDIIDSIIIETPLELIKTWVWSQIQGNSVDIIQKNNLSIYFTNTSPGDLKVFQLNITLVDNSTRTYYIQVRHVVIVEVLNYINFYTQHFPLYFQDEVISTATPTSGKINDTTEDDVGKLQLTNFNYTGGLIRFANINLPTINDKLKIQTFTYLNTSFIKVVLQTYTHPSLDKLVISNFTYLSGAIRQLLIQYPKTIFFDKITISNFTYTSGSIT